MINPSEISEVLKQQLENVNNKVSFQEVGTVLEVGDLHKKEFLARHGGARL